MEHSPSHYLTIDGMRVRYRSGGHGPQVLLLHGWGGTIESFTPVYRDLIQAYSVHAFDLPGFGESSLPPMAWGGLEYAQLTLTIMDRLRLNRPHVVAHSFGGQVAITLAAAHPDRVERLVLVGSAGVRVPPRPGVRLKRIAASGATWLGVHGGWLGQRLRNSLYRRIQSTDYANAGPLRSTLVKVLSEDLRDLLPRIHAPTLLVWGEQDTAVPLASAQLMARLLPDARLVVLQHAGHFPYLDQFTQFRLIVGRFLRGEGDPMGVGES
jgi:pimeloyl-ACP methyl ester carboxylesterase